MDSYRLYLLARMAWAICWASMVTVNLVFMVEVAGLDPLQMVLVGTVLEFSVFVFEIPTGVLADTVSRRLSVIIGHAVVGLGFLVIVVWPNFHAILLSQVIWGFGYTFISGAYAAWVSSELGVSRANEAFLRGSQLAHAAAFVGIVSAVALAHISLAIPIAAGAIGLIVLAIALSLLMREDHFQPTAVAQRDTWQAVRVTLMSGVTEIRSRPVLVSMLAITMVFGMFSEGIDRLFTPYLIDEFEFPAIGPLDSVTWWGIIAAVSSAFGLAATTIARSRVDLEDQFRLTNILSGLLVGVSLGVLLLANLDSFFVVLACYWLVGALRSAYGPLMTSWLNRLLPEDAKATLFSIYGQADSIGQSFGGPVIGALAKYVSIGFALGISALSLLPTLPLYKRMSRQLKK